jgi:branched-chain amino acid transport system permease protein
MSIVNLVVQGVLLGGYYALLACGLSLMFGVMRVINLAHGDLAVLAAFLVLSISSFAAVSPFLALVAVVPIMAAVGWLLQRGIIERSLRSGMLVPLLATFGLSIAIENLLFEAYGADTRSLGDMIGDLAFDSMEVTTELSVSYLAALIFALAVALLGGLSLFLNRTSLGRAIRATAEDPDTAELVGVDARAVYAVAAGIAVATVAIAGTMLAMRATFDSYSGPMQLIFAFEAVVIGGIGSLWGTLIGGIVLGLAQSIGAAFNPNWFLLAGHLTFFAVLGSRLLVEWVRSHGGLRSSLVAAFARSRAWRRAGRSAVARVGPSALRAASRSQASPMSGAPKFALERWTRESGAFGVAVVIIVGALAVTPLVGSANVVDKLTTLFIYIILAAMWNALAGYAGLVSVGQQAFFGIGAYFAIRLSAHGFPAYPSLMAGAIGAALLAIPISYFMLRLRGGEFSIGMWVLAEAMHLFVNQDPLIQGETGTSMISLNAFPQAERLASNYWLALGSMLALLGAMFALLRSPFGATVQAIRDDEEAAGSVGVKVLATKRTVFVLAAFGCALAGALWLATSITFQPKTNFGVQWTAYMILMTLVGGLGTFEGPILGAVLFFVLQNEFGENGVWYMAGLGVVAILFALFLPRGLWGEVESRFGLRLLPVGYRLRMAADLGRKPDDERVRSKERGEERA